MPKLVAGEMDAKDRGHAVVYEDVGNDLKKQLKRVVAVDTKKGLVWEARVIMPTALVRLDAGWQECTLIAEPRSGKFYVYDDRTGELWPE